MKPSQPYDNQETSDLFGLLPAGGKAKRIQPLPCSKEIYPVGFMETSESTEPRPKTVSEYLLEQMHLAGVRKAYVVLRRGKWDIPSYLEGRHSRGIDMAYLVLEKPYGVPFTIDKAYPFVKNTTVVFGFPDILVWPKDTYTALLDRLRATGADIVLGLFPTEDPRKVDMVEVDSNGRPKSILIKPERCALRYAWINAVWRPVFTRFLHDHITELESSWHPLSENGQDHATDKEWHLGHVIQAAIHAGLALSSVTFEEGRFIDIGTPDDLIRGVVSLMPSS